jgi:tetratricopeptide (TPR) repeat protein
VDSLDALQARVREAQRVADYATVERLARELAELAAKEENVVAEGHAYAYLGGALVARNDGPAARAAFARAKELYERAGDEAGVARSLNGLAVAALDIDLDVHEARMRLEQALAIAHRLDDTRQLGQALGNLAEVQRYEANYSGAIRSARQALTIMEGLEDHARAAWQLINIAHCLFLQRDREQAVRTMRSAYEHLRLASHDARVLAWYFDVWFVIAAGFGEWETAVRLIGFGKRVRDDSNLVRLQLLLPWISGPMEALCVHFSAHEIDVLVHEGGELTLEEADALTRAPAFSG